MSTTSEVSEVRQLKTDLARERAKRNKDFDEAYPDVGMPLPWACYVDKALEELGYVESDVDYRELSKK